MSLNLPATIPSALTATVPLDRLVFVVIRLELEWIMNIRITKAFQCMLRKTLSANSYTRHSWNHLLHDQGLRLGVVL
jgi:hypothetical protein